MLATLEADRTRLANIEAKIQDIKRSLDALCAEKTLVQSQLNSYKYPVLTLPNEIVSEIFVHFLPTYPQCPPLTGILSPTSLTHICRKWREVALTTPALWRAIMPSDNTPFELQHHIIDTWLSRSRCPLSITFEPSPRFCSLSVAVPHRARWEHLQLRIVQSELTALAGPMPLLRHLDLKLHSHTVFAFDEAPLLRTVILNMWAASSVILPWTQLTSLTLSFAFPHDCVRILRQAPNLIHFEVYLYDIDTDSDRHPEITLPVLRSLILNKSNITPTRDFLDTLFAPSLRHLRIAERFLGANPIESLRSFIFKPGCTLQEVYIIGERVIPKDSYRKAFPKIPEFSFTGPYFGETSDEEDSEVESDSNSE
ncbi:hypothetical protein B0H13DRAFT_751156 [Mycena leptocephala]|nr:hypothetical protein B0H13DRAFT_751156 [Mycena leptocephala]